MTYFQQKSRAVITHINRLWRLACNADTLGAWATVYELIQESNETMPVGTVDQNQQTDFLETLDFLQSIAFMRYAMIEKRNGPNAQKPTGA